MIVKHGVEFSVTKVLLSHGSFCSHPLRSNPFLLDLPKQSLDALLSPNPICVLQTAHGRISPPFIRIPD